MSEQGGEQGEVTQLLGAWREGDSGARDRMIALVYDQVRQLAARHLRRQYGQQAVTLQPTELANELFIKLLDADAAWEDRRHFYNAAAVAMRRILIDAARARSMPGHSREAITRPMRARSAPESMRSRRFASVRPPPDRRTARRGISVTVGAGGVVMSRRGGRRWWGRSGRESAGRPARSRP